jgi:ribosome-associated toxin RatA of RatAB toxin-antitoxin module
VPKISASTSIEASPAAVFAYAADFRHATSIVPGLSRFEPTGEVTTGLGASFAAVMALGPSKYEATLAITVYDPDRSIGWATTTSPTQSLLWTFEPDGERTSVEFELGVELPGGITGNLLAMTIEPLLRSRAKEAAAALKSQVEAVAAGDGAAAAT